MADVDVALRWQGEALRFRGGVAGGVEIDIDGDGADGASPMTALALALAGCMAVDVLDITKKMRLPVSSLEVLVSAERNAEPPRRYTSMRLLYRIGGVAAKDEEKVWRAIDLSREKYCSVWHSLREDIPIAVELELG